MRSRIEVDVPADAFEPTSERVELRSLHKINGKTAVRHGEPWAVVRVGLRGFGTAAHEELGQTVATTRTKLGAIRAANKIASSEFRSRGRTAYVVQCDGSDYVWHRADLREPEL